MSELDENPTPEQLGELIRDLVLTSRKSAKHREKIDPRALKGLAEWEREITLNYGVEKCPK